MSKSHSWKLLGIRCTTRSFTTVPSSRQGSQRLHAVVVGASFAGLSSALALRQLGFRVTVKERRKHLLDTSHGFRHPYVGMWSNAVTRLRQLDIDLSDVPQARLSEHSSLRNQRGAVLARPSPKAEQMKVFHSHDVLAKLHSKLMEQQSSDNLTVEWGVSVHDVDCLRGQTAREAVHLIVGADGVESVCRQSSPAAFAAAAPDVVGPFPPCPSFLHNVVWRGVARGQPSDVLHSFQTWGDSGQRFAVIPVPSTTTQHSGDTVDVQWYATLRPPLSSSERPDTSGFWSADFVFPQGQQMRLDGLCSVPFTLPALEQTPEAHLSFLQSQFSDFHHPIPLLLSATDPRTLVCCPGFGTRNSVTDYLVPASGMRTPHGADTERLILPLGDASHALDPALAQGLGVAFEDACCLRESLEAALADHPRLRMLLNESSDEEVDEAEVKAFILSAFNRFGAERNPRLHRLRTLSQLYTALGQIPYPIIGTARNALVRALPDALKSPVFDWLIRRSIGM